MDQNKDYSPYMGMPQMNYDQMSIYLSFSNLYTFFSGSISPEYAISEANQSIL